MSLFSEKAIHLFRDISSIKITMQGCFQQEVYSDNSLTPQRIIPVPCVDYPATINVPLIHASIKAVTTC